MCDHLLALQISSLLSQQAQDFGRSVPNPFPLKVGSGNETTSNDDSGFPSNLTLELTFIEVVSFPDPKEMGLGSLAAAIVSVLYVLIISDFKLLVEHKLTDRLTD